MPEAERECVRVQARWQYEQVHLVGNVSEWSRTGDSGSRSTFRFCPACGATIAYVSDSLPEMTAVPVGAFADPAFPVPACSMYEERRHAWAAVVADGIEHLD